MGNKFSKASEKTQEKDKRPSTAPAGGSRGRVPSTTTTGGSKDPTTEKRDSGAGQRRNTGSKNSGTGQPSNTDTKPTPKQPDKKADTPIRQRTDVTSQKHTPSSFDQRGSGLGTATEQKKQDGGAEIVKAVENKKNKKPFVAAIDFGTTYSGYACLTGHDFTNNKTDRTTMHCPSWIRDGGMSHKAPTTVLFRPNKTFHSFGHDAEKFYNDNPENQDFKEWYYFKHFKMKLYTDKDMLSKDTEIEDNREVGRTMKALDVFASVIAYFKDHLFESFKKRNDDSQFINNDEVHWVLTVPAIWDLKAKQFMKDAAEKAGITGDQLTLALEPEAASLYCRKVPVSVETTKDGGKAIAAMQKGSRYIVFDQGGGTTDITVHEVTGPDTLKEIHQACGGHYGGNTVNQEFFKFLSRLFSGPVINQIRTEHPSEYFEFMTTFEQKKTSFEEKEPDDEKSLVTLRIPIVWLQVFEDLTEETLTEVLPSTTFKGKVVVDKDKFRINNKIFRSFFDFSVENVLRVFEELLNKPEIANINTLLAVGGYSESPVLIGAIKEKFPHLNVIVPRDPGLAVLKGAVLYGYEPHSITERVSRYTYGVAMQLPYDPNKHLSSKISSIKGRGGKSMVDDIFDKHVEIGQVLKIGEFQSEHDYYPLVDGESIAHFEFYASENENPTYTTDPGCQLIGTFSVSITKAGKIFLKLYAGGTEVLAVVREEETGKESRAYFNLF